MNKNDERNQGCGCQADLKKEVKTMVKEGSKPTKAQHDKKKAEVSAAFKDDKKTGKSKK